MIAAGIELPAILQAGRWKSTSMVNRYGERLLARRSASVTVRLDPEADGRGLSLALTPRWGAPAGGAGTLWREEMPNQTAGASGAGAAQEDTGALDVRLGYGFGQPQRGLLTPFVEAGLAGADNRRLRLRTRFEARRGALALELAGERRESASRPEHALRLELRIGF